MPQIEVTGNDGMWLVIDDSQDALTAFLDAEVSDNRRYQHYVRTWYRAGAARPLILKSGAGEQDTWRRVTQP